MATTTITEFVTDIGSAYGEPCVEWTNGELKGSLPHLPLPAWRVAPRVGVECQRCNQHLYTYQEGLK